MTTQARQLPIAVPLVRAETISSYLNRIAKANHLNPLHLASCLSTDNRRITRPDPDRLDLLTGHPAERLTSLIVGLDPSRSRMKSPVGTLACRRCMAQRGIVHDVRRVTPDLLLCQRHRRWTGDVEIPSAKQYDLTPVPDVVCAQRRHHHLLRLHGGSFRVTFQDAKHIHHRWTERGDWPGPRTRRLGAYFDLQQWRIPPHHPIMDMANYPETVALAALLASDRWSALAVSSRPQDGKRFELEVTKRLRIPYEWYTAHDPLGRWRRAEAWQRRFTKLLNYNGPSAAEVSHPK